MAETTDRPREMSDVPPAGAVPGGEAEPVALPPPGSETYRPLSLLAMAGFGIAILYGLIVLFGAVIALINHIPWLLPTWTFLIPLLVIFLCWIARRRILNSEDTLSGLSFTTWGLRVGIIVGLTYAAYYASSYFAVRQQAMSCADEYFRWLKAGRPDKAFVLSMGPASQRVGDEELRNMIQATHNTPSGGMRIRPGPFTLFSEQEYVRLLQIAGDEAQVTPLGMINWDYEKGGYRAVLKYQVASPLSQFQVFVDLVCPDSKPGERGGPQWHIVTQGSGETRMDPATIRYTPQGDELRRLGMAAYSFGFAWTNKVNQQRWDEAYLDTLPPKQREALGKAVQDVCTMPTGPAAGLTVMGLHDEASRAYLAGRQKFHEGSIIQLDEKKFWTTREQRADILQYVRRTFQPAADGRPVVSLQLQQGNLPLMRSDDGERVLLFDVTLLYSEPAAATPKYLVMGSLAVAVDENDVKAEPPPCRIKALEFGDFSSGRTAPMTPPRYGREAGR